MALGAKLAETQSIGNKNASIQHIWGVDKDPYAIKTYNANDLGEGVNADAMLFANDENDGKNISDFEKIDALAFGFPCNDFSIVGKKRGLKGDYGNLYRAGVIAIEKSNPKWFVAENVSGIRSSNEGNSFKKILEDLKGAGQYGYNITTHLYKFEDYAVPQYRHRYIIVGVRKDYNKIFKVPAPTHINRNITVSEALGRGYRPGTRNLVETKQSLKVADRLLFTPPWKNAWHIDDLVLMSSDKRRDALKQLPWYDDKIKHLTDAQIISRLNGCKLNCKSARMSHIYKRLHPDKASYTITGSGGGGTHVYHWEECRALTNRERARLQSFPDDFVFEGTKESVRRQIGMAVPPIAAKIIFESILKTFLDIEYDSVPQNYDL